MTLEQNNTPKLLKLYREAIANVPILKYSWAVIAASIVLAIVANLKPQNRTVFLYTIVVILVSFFGFLVSLLSRSDKPYIVFLRYFLMTCIVITMATVMLGFATFVFLNYPEFYKRWFPDQHVPVVDTASRRQSHDSSRTNNSAPQVFKNRSTTKKKSNADKILSIQLSSESEGYSKIYIEGTEVNALAESTKFNPRIDVSPYATSSQILIITKRGDSCFSVVPVVIDSNTYRIVPNCK
jgi:hypothetical protein